MLEGFPRPEYRTGLPFPSRMTFPSPGWNPHLLVSFIRRILYHWSTREAKWSEGGSLKSPRPGGPLPAPTDIPCTVRVPRDTGVRGCLSTCLPPPSPLHPLARKLHREAPGCLRCWVSVDAKWKWGAERRKQKPRRGGFLPDTLAEDPLAQERSTPVDRRGGHCGQSPRSERSLYDSCVPALPEPPAVAAPHALQLRKAPRSRTDHPRRLQAPFCPSKQKHVACGPPLGTNWGLGRLIPAPDSTWMAVNGQRSAQPLAWEYCCVFLRDRLHGHKACRKDPLSDGELQGRAGPSLTSLWRKED